MSSLAKRRQKDTAAFSVRVSPEVKTALEEIAYNERRSLSMMVALILEREIERQQKNTA